MEYKIMLSLRGQTAVCLLAGPDPEIRQKFTSIMNLNKVQLPEADIRRHQQDDSESEPEEWQFMPLCNSFHWDFGFG